MEEDRTRLLQVVYAHLLDEGLFDTAQRLLSEARIPVPVPVAASSSSSLATAPPRLDQIWHEYQHAQLEAQLRELQMDSKSSKEWDAYLYEEEEENEEEAAAMPARIVGTLKGSHYGGVVSVRFRNAAANGAKEFDNDDDLLFGTVSADKTVQLHRLSATGEVSTGNVALQRFTPHVAGVLSLDFCPADASLLLCSGMDGMHHLLHTDGRVLQSWKDHKRYVVCIRWSPDGNWFATGSYDKSLCLYKRNDASSHAAAELFKLECRFSYDKNVECLCFTKDSKSLVASVREDNYLHYYDVQTKMHTPYNMNSNGDDFVSFTAMDLSFSPNGRHLLVSTDKNRLILFRANSSQIVFNIWGVTNDSLGYPKHCWHPSGRYAFATTDGGMSICVIQMKHQRIIGHLKGGHTGIIRDIHCHQHRNWLLSCSFDETVHVWGQ